jgi:hypothetical protein
MFVVATNDRYAPVGETRGLYRAVKARGKRLEVLSGAAFDGRHGWDLLADQAGGDFTPVAAAVAAFVTAHTGG